jgi:hypothetical protein
VAIIKSLEGLRINNSNATNSGYGGAVYHNTRNTAAYQSGINAFKIDQNGATSIRQIGTISYRWTAFRTSAPLTEIPMLYGIIRFSLNTGGVISLDDHTWISWGGNGIMWPSVGIGGNSLFLGGNNGSSTGIRFGYHLHISCAAWNQLTITPFLD